MQATIGFGFTVINKSQSTLNQSSLPHSIKKALKPDVSKSVYQTVITYVRVHLLSADESFFLLLSTKEVEKRQTP